jgi:hypothetical protein
MAAMKLRGFRLSDDTYETAFDRAEAEGRTLTDVVRVHLDSYGRYEDKAGPRQVTDAEAVQLLARCMAMLAHVPAPELRRAKSPDPIPVDRTVLRKLAAVVEDLAPGGIAECRRLRSRQ